MGHVVVGIDGSAGSEDALRWAAVEAETHDHALGAVTVFDYSGDAIAGPWAVGTAPSIEEVEERAREVLARTVSAAGVSVPGPDQRVVNGRVPDVLLELGRDAAMIVVGSRGLGGFRGLLLGSVSRQIAARSPVPAVVVPPGWRGHGWTRMVVGLDGSDEAADAVRWALDEAAAHGAVLDVVHARPDAPMIGTRVPLPPEAIADLEALAQEDGEELAREVLGRSLPPEVRVRGLLGQPSRRLLEAAGSADLLVVGSRGRGRISTTLLGSTSAACVAHAPCPTVVVHRDAAARRTGSVPA